MSKSWETEAGHAALDAELVVERYLTGRLDPTEREAFEQHYLDCPQCLESLELGRRLQQALAQVAGEESARGAAIQQLSLLAALARLSGRGRALLIAALLFLALVPGLLLIERWGQMDALQQQLRSAQSPAALLYLSPMRSVDQPQTTTIRLSDAQDWVVFALELRDVDFPAYRASLRREGRITWQVDDLLPNARGEILLNLPAQELEPGKILLELEGTDGDTNPAPVASYGLSVLGAAQ